MFGLGNKNKKTAVLIIPARQFDESEVEAVAKVLKQHSINCINASTIANVPITGMNHGTLKADIKTADIYLDECDALIFIGGIGARDYYNDMNLHRLLKSANKIGKVIGAIDFAPMILAHAEILHNKRVAVMETEEQKLVASGAIYSNKALEVDGNIVTSKGTVYAQEFAEAIVRLING